MSIAACLFPGNWHAAHVSYPPKGLPMMQRVAVPLIILLSAAMMMTGCSKKQDEGKRTFEQSTKEVNGLHVTLVQIGGTYLAPGGPMMESQGKKPNFRLLGAIVEAPEGSVFFKLTGPRKTIEAAHADFDTLVNSIRKMEGGGESPHSVAGVIWRIPSNWSVQEPRPMRVATYMVPAVSGDSEGGECGIFYFGNDQGGSVEANIERWKSQFEEQSTAS